MPYPIEDAYVQFADDTSRYWSTAQKAYVTSVPVGYTPVIVGSVQDITDTLVNLGLGPLAPIPQPAPVDPVAALQAQVAALTSALQTAGTLTPTQVTGIMDAPVPATPLS